MIRFGNGGNIDDWNGGTWTATGHAICPDLLRLDQLGAADNMRGRVVRAFFWLLDRVWAVR